MSLDKFRVDALLVSFPFVSLLVEFPALTFDRFSLLVEIAFSGSQLLELLVRLLPTLVQLGFGLLTLLLPGLLLLLQFCLASAGLLFQA